MLHQTFRFARKVGAPETFVVLSTDESVAWVELAKLTDIWMVKVHDAAGAKENLSRRFYIQPAAKVRERLYADPYYNRAAKIARRIGLRR